MDIDEIYSKSKKILTKFITHLESDEIKDTFYRHGIIPAKATILLGALGVSAQLGISDYFFVNQGEAVATTIAQQNPLMIDAHIFRNMFSEISDMVTGNSNLTVGLKLQVIAQTVASASMLGLCSEMLAKAAKKTFDDIKEENSYQVSQDEVSDLAHDSLRGATRVSPEELARIHAENRISIKESHQLEATPIFNPKPQAVRVSRHASHRNNEYSR